MAAATPEEGVRETWEELDKLHVWDLPPPKAVVEGIRPGGFDARPLEGSNDNAANSGSEERQVVIENNEGNFGNKKEAESIESEVDNVDVAIKQALLENKERLTVYRIEEQVCEFLQQEIEEVLEFPSNYSNYQRMLAHKVAQHYGLQTSTVGYEEGQGKVVAKRTSWTKLPQVKLANLTVRLPPKAHGYEKTQPKVLTKRPSGQGFPPASMASLTSAELRNMATPQEREEDYHLARERIIGPAAPEQPQSKGRRQQEQGGGGKGGANGSGRGSDAARARKAVFRDRDKELQDPDYRRGAHRFQTNFDPSYGGYDYGLYNTPSYNTQFPALGKGGPMEASPRPGYHSAYGVYGPPSSGVFQGPPPPPPPRGQAYGQPPPQVRPYGAASMPPYVLPGVCYPGGMPPMGPAQGLYGPQGPMGMVPMPPGNYAYMHPGMTPEGLPLGYNAPFPMYGGFPGGGFPYHPPYGQMPTPPGSSHTSGVTTPVQDKVVEHREASKDGSEGKGTGSATNAEAADGDA